MSDLEGDSDLFNDASTSEEDDYFLLDTVRRKKENYLDETVPQYEEDAFLEHFRITRRTVQNMAQEFEQSQQYKQQSGNYGKLSSLSQMLIVLWYIGHQTASFRDVADRFNISISCLHRVLKRVVIFLSNLSSQIITWPTDAEKLTIEQHFNENGFPGVIGIIDSTHIKIDKPERDPDSYLNTKGFYSIHMQAVCDHTCRILDIVIGYPGSVHNSRVFTNSPLASTLENKCGRYFLLGDSGYPLRKTLLTPFKDRGQLTRRQLNYNIKLLKNRYVIEHCFGILKQKFRVLYHVKLRSIPIIVHLIRAACVLHNVSLNGNFLLQDIAIRVQILPQNEIADGEEEDDGDDDDRGARGIRDRIVRTLRA